MTRRPVLPGASELFFRRTDAAAADPAPVSQLPTLAAAAASPSLRGNAAKRSAPGEPELPAEDAPDAPAAPFQLIRGRAEEQFGTLRSLPAAAPRSSRSSHRTKHDEKITVYCSAEELLALETARLTLRADHGVVADRGRIVREAISVLLADLDTHGENSVLARRLQK